MESSSSDRSGLSRVRELAGLGQSIWLDNISRDLMDSGKLENLINKVGIQGMTSNPTIFEKAINGSQSYDQEISFLAAGGYSSQQVVRLLMVRDIRRACDFFLPVHKKTSGRDGFVSIEVNPLLAHRTDETVQEAKLLHGLVNRPNLMVKVPGTPEGMPAIEALTAIGMSINVTLLFSPDAYRDAAMAYVRGLESFVSSGGDPSTVHSVASVFVSRIDTLVDRNLDELLKTRATDKGISALLGKAGVANSRIIYRLYREIFHGERFASLKDKRANMQRPLWASTGTKNPKYSDVLYLDSLIAPETVNTVPEQTLNYYLDHGAVALGLERKSFDEDNPDPVLLFDRLEQLGIRREDVFSQLVSEGVKSFDQSFETLTGALDEKAKKLVPDGGVHHRVSVPDEDWKAVIHEMESRFRSGKPGVQ
ncbi:MAG: transaldolase [Leptospirales bacterium]